MRRFQNQTQLRLLTQTYSTDRQHSDNEILPSAVMVPSQRHPSNDSSLGRMLDGVLPHGQGFITGPARSTTTHSSISANPSYADRPDPSVPPSLGWSSRAHNGHRGPDPPEPSNASQHNSMSTSSQLHSKWATPSAGQQHQKTLVLPLPSSPPTVAATSSSQSILKLNHHVKKSGGSEKKQTLACLFCRERKIACGRPAEGSADSTCK
jgi:hypothetical protein